MTNERRPSRIPVRGSLALGDDHRRAGPAHGLPLTGGCLQRGARPRAHGRDRADRGTGGGSAGVLRRQPWGQRARDGRGLGLTLARDHALGDSQPAAEATPGTQTATGNAYQFRFGDRPGRRDRRGRPHRRRAGPPAARRRPTLGFHQPQVEPMLRQSALAADSADIDVVSGATYTSTAYAYSLQSALDQLADGLTVAAMTEPPGRGRASRRATRATVAPSGSWAPSSASSHRTAARTRRRRTGPSPGCTRSTGASAPSDPTAR